MTRVWAEVWTRPGDANFGRVIDDPQFTRGSLHGGLNQIGDGTGTLPDSFDRFDEILFTDPDTPSNCVRSLIRLFAEDPGTDPVFLGEWLPNQLVPPQDKDDADTEIRGVGMNAILAYARTEPWDWDGSDEFVSTFPDWVYGGRNLLTSYSLTNIRAVTQTYELYTDATGGTLTLSDGTDTTMNINFDDPPSTLDARLETDITAITEVNVGGPGGGGTETTPWIIEFVTPAYGVTLTVDGSGLTGGSATLTLIQEGSADPSPWTKNKHVSPIFPAGSQPFGNPTTFEVSTDQILPGSTYSVKVEQPDPYDPTCQCKGFAGTQQVVSVTPGGTYQAVGNIYPTDASDTFFLSIRAFADNEFIASSTGTITAGTLTPNMWNEVTISDVVIPDNVDKVIFRYAQAGTDDGSDPSVFYVDVEQAEFNEGLAADTVGKILGDLYDDAVSDHSGRVVWEDEANPGNPYLTLDFTDTLDSNGNAWSQDESIRIPMRFSYSQVMAQFAKRGYEYRIVPDDLEAGSWLWQVYNPGGMDASPDVAVQGGAADIRRRILRRLAEGSDFMVEGESRISGRARDTDLIDAIGRIEASRIDREVTSLGGATDEATQDLATAQIQGQNLRYTLTNPQDEPLVDFTYGDTVTVEDPPEVDTLSRRFVDLNLVFSPQSVEWECQFGGVAVVAPDAAVADAVAGLLAKFEYADEVGGGDVEIGGGPGGESTVLVAASDAAAQSTEKADYICAGVNDQEVINEALASGTRRVRLSEGTFNTSAPIVLPDESYLLGNGWLTTSIVGAAGIDAIIESGYGAQDLELGHFTIRGQSTSDGSTGLDIPTNGVHVHDVWFESIEQAISLGTTDLNMHGVYMRQVDIAMNGTISGARIWGCEFAGDVDLNVSGARLAITGNTFNVASFKIAGDNWAVTGNVWNDGSSLTDPALITISGSDEWTFTGNTLACGGYDAMSITGAVTGTVADNTFYNLTGGIHLDTCSAVNVHGNHLGGDDSETGYLGEHGVHVEDSTNCKVQDNTIWKPGQDLDDTYDGVYLTGTTEYTAVDGNRIIGAAASPQPRSAVTDDTDLCNWVVGNYLDEVANFATAPITPGALTQLFFPGDLTNGDNFVGCVSS